MTDHAALALRSRALSVEENAQIDLQQWTARWNAELRTRNTSYKQAFARWTSALSTDNDQDCTVFRLQCRTRLYTGGGELHPWETNVAIHRTFGAPVLPGSGLKGMSAAHCRRLNWATEEEKNNVLATVFGVAAGDNSAGASGTVIFHDAWWIPDQEVDGPFVPEIVTPHHQDYYSGANGEELLSRRIPRGDTEPVPAAQIAVTGRFLFALEGEASARDLAIALLKSALEHEGFGARTSLGYGRFGAQGAAQKYAAAEALERNEFAKRFLQWSDPEAIKILSQPIETLRKEFGADWPTIHAHYRHHFGHKLKTWTKEYSRKTIALHLLSEP